jgi:RNA recognition motif-containing protein
VNTCSIEKTKDVDGKFLSKGYGYVTFADQEEAKKAVDKFNNFDVQGSKLTVTLFSEAKNREPSSKQKTLHLKASGAVS